MIQNTENYDEWIEYVTKLGLVSASGVIGHGLFGGE